MEFEAGYTQEELDAFGHSITYDRIPTTNRRAHYQAIYGRAKADLMYGQLMAEFTERINRGKDNE